MSLNYMLSPHKVEKAHTADVHYGHWNSNDENYILTRFHRRNLTSDGLAFPVHKFVEPKAAVLCVQWCPDESSVFGSSVEDGDVNIRDYKQNIDLDYSVFLHMQIETMKSDEIAMVAEQRIMEAPQESRKLSKQKRTEERKKQIGKPLILMGWIFQSHTCWIRSR